MVGAQGCQGLPLGVGEEGEGGEGDIGGGRESIGWNSGLGFCVENSEVARADFIGHPATPGVCLGGVPEGVMRINVSGDY